MTTLEMFGLSDLIGQKFGSCMVLGMASRRPAPRWNVTCSRCHSQWQEDHVKITNAGNLYRCRNVGCAKAQKDEVRQPVGVPTSDERIAVQTMDVDGDNVNLLRSGIGGTR
jgi:hypothetical protein